MIRQVERLWPGGVSDGLNLPCGVCGQVPRFDYAVADSFWRATVPEEHRLGVVCLPCLNELCGGQGLAEALLRIQWCGTGHTVDFRPVGRYKYAQDSRVRLVMAKRQPPHGSPDG